VFDFVLKPVRSVVQALNEDTVKPLEQTERETLDAVKAIDRATQSIEHHVEVIETLATSVGPLTASVDRLTETMRQSPPARRAGAGGLVTARYMCGSPDDGDTGL
jgi:hypothetical protein